MHSYCLALLLPALVTTAFAVAPTRFDFGDGPVAPGYAAVGSDTLYTAERGYGLLLSQPVQAATKAGVDPLASDALAATGSFSFAIELPEGNYRVAVLLGDPSAAAETTVKAESRRLLVEAQKTAPGETLRREFTVNIRRPEIAGGGRIALKERERAPGVFHWDNQLTLEFNGPRAAVAALSIVPEPDALTLYLAGDSTVTDQPNEPWSAWGAMLPRFFSPGVAIANHAESGLSLRSFKSQKRLAKILSVLRPGDYVFVQFGHNDQKEKGENVGAFTSYAESLRDYVDTIRAKGGQPVLVSPMYRRRFPDGKLADSLGDYPAAVKQVAEEKKVPYIDLHALSGALFSALGPEKSKLAFVFYPASTFPGQEKDLADNTHFSAYGGYELARCMVEGIRENVPELAARLAPDAGRFDPARPDAPETFRVPPSPLAAAIRIPDGDGR